MRINLIVSWDKAPPKGRVHVSDGRLVNGLICVGWGQYNQADGRFSFTSVEEMCRIAFAIDVEARDAESVKATFHVSDTARPVSVSIREVLRQPGGTLRIKEGAIELCAEIDAWESLSESDSSTTANERKPAMALPLYKGFTDEQRKQFGPVRERQVLKTEKRVYSTPFMYPNVKVGDFYEIDPTKGIELKSMAGFITIDEDRPIAGVTVVGSGCVPKGFNVCEWWDDGETIDNMTNQLVKRQRIDDLHGTHPSIYSQLMMGTFPGLTFSAVTEGQIRSAAQCLKQLTDGYYTGYFMGFYENVANFRPGPPYPKKVTIRAGTKLVEDAGTIHERFPADYAVRVIETTVLI